MTSTVEFPHLQIGEADFIPAAGFQNATRAAFYPKFAAEGVSSFFSFYSVYDVLKKRTDPNKSKTTFGKIYDNFALNLVLQLADALAGASALVVASSRVGSTAQMTNAMYRDLYAIQQANQLSSSSTVISRSATSRSAVVIDKLGKCTAAIGCLLYTSPSPRDRG